MKLTDRLKSSKLYPLRVRVERLLDGTLGLFLFNYQKRDNLFNWFYNCIKYQVIDNPDCSPKYNYYEFGVASGGSMKIYVLALQKFCRDYRQDIRKFHIYGFDSFAGLPEPQEADKREDWQKGGMKHQKDEVLSVFKSLLFPLENVHLIEGFFDKSLTAELRRTLSQNPPAIVNMDADYYSSTMTVFNWIHPILASGCFFRFDDMWSFYGHPEKGVVKAINDFNKSGNGTLTRFPVLGLDSYAYVYSRKDFEYV